MSEGGVTRSMEATETPEAARVERERRTLSSGAWGILLLIATELTLFSSLIATYFYLRFKDPTWPPPGVPKPEVTLPLIFTGMLIVSVLPMAAAVRAGAGARARLALGLLIVAAAIQATYLGLQIHLFVDDFNKVVPSETAYGSIYVVLLGLHHAHVAAGLAVDAWLITRLAGGITNYRLLALRVTSYYWYFVAAIAIPVVLTQLYPSL
jgi:heme/copper-type cytochrome/quinol oxidase subunit 3